MTGRVRRGVHWSRGPLKLYFSFRVQTPNPETPPGDAKDRAHSLGFRVKLWMAKEPTRETCGLVLVNIHAGQTISPVAQVTLVETKIECEERRVPQVVQEGDDLIVLYPLPSRVVANMPNRKVPASEEHALF